MATSYLFYDLETSGFNPREARIMQFAGQRTDRELKPIGEPFNYLIRLSEDVLPDPDAVLLTGITPQVTIAEGITEAEFLRIFSKEIALPDTIFVGFNSIRFDDEFMRFLLYRNYYDAYEWQWQNGKSKWDMLDVVRMTRALRPEGIKWPVDSKGKPANRLTLLTSINGLDHKKAHDALNDVQATIGLAQLLKAKQPRLFDYLLKVRDKKFVAELAESGKVIIYTSGKYPSEFEKTTAVVAIASNPNTQGVLVYDLRHDPTPFLTLSPVELAEAWKYSKDETKLRLPIKTMKYNRCPAIAPLSVLDKVSQERLQLTPAIIQSNLKKLTAAKEGFVKKVLEALELLDKHQQATFLSTESEVDAQLYDGFFEASDKKQMDLVRIATGQELKDLSVKFDDSRLTALLPLYKARNFSKSLSDSERAVWEKFKQRKLLGGKASSQATRYFERLAELSMLTSLTDKQRFLLEELHLYGQSVLPVDVD